LIGLVVVAAVASGCSKSSDKTAPSARPTSVSTSTSTTLPVSAAAADRRACAAYEAFWNVSYSAGEPSPTMLARERDLVAAAQPASPALQDAMRGVIDGDLGLPMFYLRATAQRLRQQAGGLPADAKAALQEVVRSDRLVRSKCDAAGAASTTAG
jgi:hypothetical protein